MREPVRQLDGWSGSVRAIEIRARVKKNPKRRKAPENRGEPPDEPVEAPNIVGAEVTRL